MAKRNLTTQTMLTISERWLDPERDRPILERYPLLSALLPRLVKAHTSLVEFQRASTEAQSEIAAVQKEQAALDAEHDRKIRGVFGILTGLGELAATEEKARHYFDLRDRILPDGLRATKRSYVDEGGEVVLLQGRLDDATKSALEAIVTPEGSLYSHVLDWMKAATALVELDEKRLDIERAAMDQTRKSDVLRARNEWIRVGNGLEANIQLEDASAEDIYRLFRHLERAEARADRRAPPEALKLEDEPPAPIEEALPCANSSMSPDAEG